MYGVISKWFGIGSFTMYLNAIDSFSGPMFALTDSFVDIRRFSDYYDAVDDYLHMPQKIRGGKRLPLELSGCPAIEFEDISFRYPGQDTSALKQIGIRIDAGEKLSVVGENGAGKTTFRRAEYEIYQKFDRMVSGKTVIYISHRLSSSKFCDKIAVFSKCEIAEYGTHDGLMQNGRLYSELFPMQAQFYTEDKKLSVKR